MSKVEYRAVIKFLSKEGLATAAIKQHLDGVYGEASPLYSTVKEWAKQFRLGRDNVEDEPREGQPMEVVTEENIRRIEEELLSDRRLTPPRKAKVTQSAKKIMATMGLQRNFVD